MYNSAGEFSTFVENLFRGGRLFARVVGGLRPPPPLTGLRRGLRPLLGPGKGGFVGHWQGGRRSFFPGRACQRYNSFLFWYLFFNYRLLTTMSFLRVSLLSCVAGTAEVSTLGTDGVFWTLLTLWHKTVSVGSTLAGV